MRTSETESKGSDPPEHVGTAGHVCLSAQGTSVQRGGTCRGSLSRVRLGAGAESKRSPGVQGPPGLRQLHLPPPLRASLKDHQERRFCRRLSLGVCTSSSTFLISPSARSLTRSPEHLVSACSAPGPSVSVPISPRSTRATGSNLDHEINTCVSDHCCPLEFTYGKES